MKLLVKGGHFNYASFYLKIHYRKFLLNSSHMTYKMCSISNILLPIMKSQYRTEGMGRAGNKMSHSEMPVLGQLALEIKIN